MPFFFFSERGQLPAGRMPGPPVGILNAGAGFLASYCLHRIKGIPMFTAARGRGGGGGGGKGNRLSEYLLRVNNGFS